MTATFAAVRRPGLCVWCGTRELLTPGGAVVCPRCDCYTPDDERTR